MAEHGTHARYVAHRNAGESACDDCRRAHADYNRATAVRSRTIRARAVARLIAIHPAIYAALLAEEQDRYDQGVQS